MLERYRYSDKEKRKILDSIVYLVDTREKKNDHIIKVFEHYQIPYQKKALKCGDYSFYIPSDKELGIEKDLYFDNEIIIERKASLEELSQNFTRGRDRFEKELALAPPLKVILIENNNYSDLVHHNYETNYSEKSYLSSLHQFWFRYNCPVFMIKNARDSVVFIRYYFQAYVKELLR